MIDWYPLKLIRCIRQFGKIQRISLTKDDEGHCRGFGFIEFGTEVSVLPLA